MKIISYKDFVKEVKENQVNCVSYNIASEKALQAHYVHMRIILEDCNFFPAKTIMMPSQKFLHITDIHFKNQKRYDRAHRHFAFAYDRKNDEIYLSQTTMKPVSYFKVTRAGHPTQDEIDRFCGK